MGADETRARLWQHAYGAALADHRLLLHVEPDPLHLGQYDFGRQQPASHILDCGQLVNRHRGLDRQRPVRGADQPPQVPTDREPPPKVAGD